MKNRKKFLLTLFVATMTFMSAFFVTACAEKVSFSFEANGGTEIAAVEVSIGEEYTLPVTKREGYNFKGWYTNPNFSGDVVTKITPVANATFYAKWAKLYNIELDADGGTLNETVITAEEGANLYDTVKDYVPVKDGLVFGAWFRGINAVSETARVTGDVKLTAKYKLAYKVEIYRQNLEQNGYDKDQDKIGYAYVGETVTSDESLLGFTEVRKDDTVYRIDGKDFVIGGENTFRHYFDRRVFNVTYVDKLNDTTKTQRVVFGHEVTVPYNYTADGYYLKGWATNPTGDAVYNADYITTVLHGANNNKNNPDKFSPTDDVSLYAVWENGYKDIFGSDDYIYITDDIAYLQRGGVFFEGEYVSDDGVFVFPVGDDPLEGKVFADHTFTFYSSDRDGANYTLFVVGKGVDNNVTIILDGNNGIRYTEKRVTVGADNQEHEEIVTSNGTYTINEDTNERVAIFTDGELKGKTITFTVGTVSANNGTIPAFQIRNENEYQMGWLVRGVVVNGTLTYYYKQDATVHPYSIMLNGYGTAGYYDGSKVSAFRYIESDGVYTILDSYGRTQLVFNTVDINGVKGYIAYNSSYDHVYNGENGATLTLDGAYKATYVNGNQTITGNYSITQSSLGGAIVTLSDGGSSYVFKVTATSSTVSSDDGKEEEVYTYTFETKLSYYKEFYYRYNSNDNKIQTQPLLVWGEREVDGKRVATIYGVTSSKSYEKVLYGTIEYDEKTGLYTFTVTERYEAEVVNDPVDFTDINVIVLALDSASTTNYNIAYWYSVNGVSYVKTYTSENQGETLTLVSGVAVYTKGGASVKGIYAVSDGLLVVITKEGNLYVELDEDQGTFILLSHAPFTANVLKKNGTYSDSEAVSFDGKGNAEYKITEGSGSDKVTTTYNGTVSDTGRVTDTTELVIYSFVSAEKSFEYVLIPLKDGGYVCAKYDSATAGEYTGNGIRLILDGFGYFATYINTVTEKSYVGLYSFSGDNLINFIGSGVTFYFDITEGRTITVKGDEYGRFLLMKNRMTSTYALDLDGYGNISVKGIVYNSETNKSEIKEIGSGTYTVSDGVFTLKYKIDSTDYTVVGKRDVYVSGSSSQDVIVVLDDFAESTYVNPKDWSVLILDDMGNATKYSKDGKKITGNYTLITENLLFFISSDSSEACMYSFDVKTGVATEKILKDMGYYTENLDALRFSKYGLAIFGANDSRYYTIENGKIIVYKYDESSEDKNEFGFVAQEFGAQTDVKEWEGKTYYKNEGTTVIFNRSETDVYGDENKIKYPVLYSAGNPEKGTEDVYATIKNINFQPNGRETFTIAGKVFVNIGGEKDIELSCYVVRKLDKNGDFVTYLRLNTSSAYYRFGMKITYKGADNAVFELTDMNLVVEAESYQYMYYYNMIYSYLGPTYAASYTNEIGTFLVENEYGLDGKPVESGQTATVTFGKAAGIVGEDGKPLTLEKVKYEYHTEGRFKGLYTIDVKVGEEDFRLYLQLRKVSSSAYGFVIVAYTRIQTLATAEYDVYVERVLVSESMNAGTILISVVYDKEGNEIASDVIYNIEQNLVYYIVRNYTGEGDNKRIETSEYYVITFVEEAGSVDDNSVKAYKGVEIKKITMTAVHADAKNFFEIDAEGIAYILNVDGSAYLVKYTSYDAVTNVYTLVTSANVVFTAKTENDVTTITRTETSTIANDTQSITVDENNKVYTFTDGSDRYYVKSSSYNAETSVYTIVTTDNVTFEITVKDGAIEKVEKKD